MKLKIILASAIIALGIVGGYVFPVAKNLSLGQALPQAVAVFETSLASPISTSATSMTLTANSVRGGSTLSGFNCFTVDEGSAQAEFICGTVSGTTVSGLTRGVDPATGTSTVSALQFAHRRGANVKITDFPLITILRNQANGVETFPNLLSYADTVSIGVGSPTTTITTKAYVDGVAVAGASNGDESTKGIWEGATALEQASSTALGGTSAGLLLQSRYATDTPQSGCASGYTSTAGAGCSVIATLAGKIKQTFLNLTEAFTFSGGATSTGTTTISASHISTNPLILNGLAYRMPSTRGASSTVLIENGSGALAWDYGSNYNFGRTSTSTGGNGTLTIAHGLANMPRLMKFSYNYTSGSAGAGNERGVNYGIGIATSTASTQSVQGICTMDWIQNSPQTNSVELNSVGYVISAKSLTSVACDTTGWRAYVSAVDSTNITLTFDGTNNIVDTLTIQWEAYR